MGSPKGAERRKYSRIDTDQLISFTAVGAASGLAQSRDVSLGGIRFDAVGCNLMIGDLLRVSFNVADETIEAVGRVVWTRSLDPITAEVGLEFTLIDPWAARLLSREEEEEAPR